MLHGGLAPLQELGPEQHWVSEALFATLFLMFFGWSFTPFVTHRRKRFYTVVLWSRLLMVLVGERGVLDQWEERLGGRAGREGVQQHTSACSGWARDR